MKKYVKMSFVCVALVAYSSAFAGGPTETETVTVGVQTNPTAIAGARSGDSGVNFAPTSTSTNYGSKIPVASAATPIITTSNDTCMGSTSGSVSTVTIGFSLGSTWTDKNCIMLKNSREMWNMGLRDPAIARMCMDGLNRDALEVTGIQCPDFDKLRRDRTNAEKSKAKSQ